MYRLWLRRLDPWERPLDPRRMSEAWDLRCSTRIDSAFALVHEFEMRDLDAIPETWQMPEQPEELAQLKLNGDPLHDHVLRWAWMATGFGEGPQAKPAVVEPVAEPVVEAATETASDEEDGWAEAEAAVARLTGEFATVDGDDAEAKPEA